jgi:hypothetical protein
LACLPIRVVVAPDVAMTDHQPRSSASKSLDIAASTGVGKC